MPSADFQAVFQQLKSILSKYEKRCVVERDTDTDYYLNLRKLGKKKKPIFFGATSINKVSVSFYLMAVDTDCALRAAVSPELAQHLHGKCCFRFKRAEPELFQELASLTQRALAGSGAGRSDS
jgi:hypothetical protein